MKPVTFPLPPSTGHKSVNCKSISLREVTGTDEALAATIAEAKGKSGSTFNELLRLAIVKVDGKNVEQPFTDMDRWNSRTRRFLLDAFNSMNGASAKETEDFLAGAVIDGSDESAAQT